MADEIRNLQQEMDALRAQLQELEQQAKQDQTGLKAFGSAAGKGIADSIKSLGSLAVSVGQGDTSFEALSPVVDVVTNALANMAKAIPVAGEGLAQTAKASGEAAKFMLAQLDQSTKAFNDLGKVGALGTAGMKGLQDQFTKSGLPLNSFTKLVSDNAVTLARWNGTTAEGADSFSNVVHTFTQGQDDSLRKLGMNAEQIGETTMAYIAQQTRLGNARAMTEKQLKDGTRQYAIELDELGKVTGMSKNSIQAQQDKMLSNNRFRANIQEMIDNGQAGLAKNLQDLQTRVSGYGDQLGQGLADIASGVSNTKASEALMKSTGGAALDIMARLKSGAIDKAQAHDELVDALERQQQSQIQTGKYLSAAESGMIDYQEVSNAIHGRVKGADKKAETATDAQVNNTDALTETVITAQKELEGLNISMQQLGFTFLPNAADATLALSSSLKELVAYANKALGPQGAQPLSGGAGAAAGAASLGAAGAAVGSIIPGVGTVVGGALGVAVGGVAGYFGMIDYGVGNDEAASKGPETSAPGNPGASSAPSAAETPIMAAAGAILSGPTSGYRPNTSMSGIESKPLSANGLEKNKVDQPSDPSTEMFEQILNQLDSLLSSAKNQVAVRQKLAQYRS